MLLEVISSSFQPRSEIIATYALCGSASFAVMGLIIGSFEVIVPHRIGEITNHIFRAMIAGTVASYLTACFAGIRIHFGTNSSMTNNTFHRLTLLHFYNITFLMHLKKTDTCILKN
jgi:hypothetical protein